MEEDTIGEEGNKYYKDLLAEGWVFGSSSQSKNINNGTEQNEGDNAGDVQSVDAGAN